jgi:hypothetical protein
MKPTMMRFAGPLLGSLLGLAAAAPVAALVAPPPPVPARVARADCIVIGKIVALEKTEVVAFPYANAPRKANYRIAVLQVKRMLKGTKGKSTLRLGFRAPSRSQPGGGIRPTGPRFGTSFSVGQEGLFYLQKHYREPFFVAPGFSEFVPYTQPTFKQEVALVRFALRMGDHPAEGLKSKDRQERLFAAALCIYRYRTYRGRPPKTEPIGARESRLILRVLAEADWHAKGLISPWGLFSQLGLTKKDGWSLPARGRSTEDYYKAGRDWLRKFGRTYRIRRVVNRNPDPPSSKK